MNQIECVFENRSLLGEAPMWSPEEKRLYWSDILKKQFHIFDPATNVDCPIDLPEPITSINLRKDKTLLVTLKKKIAFFDLERLKLIPICTVEFNQPSNRFNDAKCDRMGRLWAGTMNATNMHLQTGALYQFNAKRMLTSHRERLKLSNGMGWSPDDAIFYHVESFRYAIFAYDFDLEKGTLMHKRIFASVDPHSGGCPDGMTVDSEGYVWSAQPGLKRLVRYHPSGKIDEIIEMPVPRPSSCIFGGENLDTLYIPTARELLTEEDLENYPLSGGLFAFKPGVCGLPEPHFAG